MKVHGEGSWNGAIEQKHMCFKQWDLAEGQKHINEENA
jgi:hypothetical protein